MNKNDNNALISFIIVLSLIFLVTILNGVEFRDLRYKVATLKEDILELEEDVCDELDLLNGKMNELEENQEQTGGPYRVRYGDFVGINYYVGVKSYVVVLIDGEEVETIGLVNYWIMDERVIVLEIEGKLYSLPLREKGQEEKVNENK